MSAKIILLNKNEVQLKSNVLILNKIEILFLLSTLVHIPEISYELYLLSVARNTSYFNLWLHGQYLFFFFNIYNLKFWHERIINSAKYIPTLQFLKKKSIQHSKQSLTCGHDSMWWVSLWSCSLLVWSPSVAGWIGTFLSETTVSFTKASLRRRAGMNPVMQLSLTPWSSLWLPVSTAYLPLPVPLHFVSWSGLIASGKKLQWRQQKYPTEMYWNGP